jgi:hypothetical protein
MRSRSAGWISESLFPFSADATLLAAFFVAVRALATFSAHDRAADERSEFLNRDLDGYRNVDLTFSLLDSRSPALIGFVSEQSSDIHSLD